MAYVPLSHFLFRAPLLPLQAVGDRRRSLLKHPLGRSALELASPDLAAAVDRVGFASGDRARGGSADAALDRYRRRAAFRPTPHGLLAGVGVGRIAPRSRVRTPDPRAVLRVAWWRLARLGRSLLDAPELRDQIRLRRAPSLVIGAHTILWLGAGSGQDGEATFVEERRADLDDLLDAVLRATAAWTPWPTVRAALDRETGGDDGGGGGGDGDGDGDGDVDDWLLTLIDDGLLHADVVPPLVGPDPADWMRDRLARLPAASAAAGHLATVVAAVNSANLEDAQNALAALPDGQRDDAAKRDVTGKRLVAAKRDVAELHATLVFPSPHPFALSAAAIDRAAALAPLLFRLQQALAPPISERAPGQGIGDALDAATEVFGAGALDLGAFALGDYGVDPAGETTPDDDAAAAEVVAEAHPALVALLVDRSIEAARRRTTGIALRAEELLPLLPPVPLPPTCELFLTPCRPRAPGRRPPGDGWLLGLHAPAGATWGRFAFALGNDARTLLAPLRDAERDARPGEEPADVIFSPSDALADVCAHPPLRRVALALTGWPADGQAALTPADLDLCADGAALEPLALRTRDTVPVAPSPLHRVRSATAPPGIWRLLVGWSLHRQQAPWGFPLGAIGAHEWTPRISIDGFVVSPASWRLPAALRARGASTRALRAWRARGNVPRWIQVGSEDALLPVDLATPGAAADLVGHQRVFEIWPPLGDTPDESGRRVEAVVGLVDQPDALARARIHAAVGATAGAGEIPPPRRDTRRPDTHAWRTFKLFGATDRQDQVLLGAVQPAIDQARRAREIAGWFFLRYVDGPGRRPHLRVRVQLRQPGDDAAFASRLDGHLAPLITGGDVVAVERGQYFPEAARFGGPDAMPAVHALFAADSDLACALLTAAGEMPDAGPDDLPEAGLLAFLVATFDALARGLQLDLAARRALARRRRDAHAPDVSNEEAAAHARQFRSLRPRLREVLTAGPPNGSIDPMAGKTNPARAALLDYRARVHDAGSRLPNDARDRMLPSLLHLSAVRLAGLNRLDEIRAYTFWERVLESLERHGVPSPSREAGS